ncbi:MAG TPA: hypothetical protein VIW73_03960 [Candidatus Cybelea sp.]
MKRFLSFAPLLMCAGLAVTARAGAQETPAPATPAPAASPTFMDRAYDGNLHILAAPYVWAPTVGGTFQYTIPNLPRRGRGTRQTSVSVPPVDYLPKVNSAVMFAFDARKGGIDVFGDYIYLNATATASAAATLTGRFGRLNVPISLSSNARVRESIWEAAAGFTVARGHAADLSIFTGMREFPLNFTFDYNATVGRRRPFSTSGSVLVAGIAQDVIFGLRGKAYFGDGHWYVPYYVDVGGGIGQLNNTTWQAYSGAGYTFNHGQSLIALYRDLRFFNLPPVSPVQKLSMYGPLFGYTFNL